MAIDAVDQKPAFWFRDRLVVISFCPWSVPRCLFTVRLWKNASCFATTDTGDKKVKQAQKGASISILSSLMRRSRSKD